MPIQSSSAPTRPAQPVRGYRHFTTWRLEVDKSGKEAAPGFQLSSDSDYGQELAQPVGLGHGDPGLTGPAPSPCP